MAKTPLRVLIVDDSADDAELLALTLQRQGYDPDWDRVDSAATLSDALARSPWECILADFHMPGFGGFEALELVQQSGRDTPFILVSGAVGEETAVAAMRAGAADYLMKDNLTRLGAAVDREVREAQTRAERRQAQAALLAEAHINDALASIGRELIGVMTSGELGDRVMVLVEHWVGGDFGHLFLRGEESDEFSAVAGYGFTEEARDTLYALRVPMSALVSMFDATAADGILLVEQDKIADRRQAELVRAYGCGVGLFVPLYASGRMVGLVTVCYRAGGAGFDPERRRILHGLAQLASLAIERGRLLDALERANRLKDDFVATMSHELRTPLNIIIGYVDLLLDGAFGSLDGEQVDIVHHVQRSARDLLSMIESTLEVSRLDTGRVEIHVAPVAADALLESLVADIRADPDHSARALRLDVAADLPELVTDAVRLRIILRNLIGNAVKFTPSGEVEVSARRVPQGVELAVRDEGIGIPTESLDEIFDPFRQLDSSNTRAFGGVGLGLYVVKRLTELLGGSIDVESVLGKGSTFRVTLPLRSTGGARRQPAAGKRGH